MTELDEILHGNDIAYNSRENKLVITCCSSGDHQYICSMNAGYFKLAEDLKEGEIATLELKKHSISCRASTIAYNETLDIYVVNVTGQYHYFAILDGDFNMVGLINGDDVGKITETEVIERTPTIQAIDCDDNYIYVTYFITLKEYVVEKCDYSKSVTSDEQNVLVILDWEGNVINEIDFTIARVKYNSLNAFYEVEDIIMFKDKVLLTFNFFL